MAGLNRALGSGVNSAADNSDEEQVYSIYLPHISTRGGNKLAYPLPYTDPYSDVSLLGLLTGASDFGVQNVDNSQRYMKIQ